MENLFLLMIFVILDFKSQFYIVNGRTGDRRPMTGSIDWGPRTEKGKNLTGGRRPKTV